MASPTASPRATEQVVDVLRGAEVVEGRHRLDHGRALPGRAQGGGVPSSVLVIVLSVRGVPVAVVDVVDVVAVLHGEVAAVLAVHVRVLAR